MAWNSTALKRQKEQAKRERQQRKVERREQRKKEGEERRKNIAPGEDPDIAGIVPGPQPVLED